LGGFHFVQQRWLCWNEDVLLLYLKKEEGAEGEEDVCIPMSDDE